MDDHRLDALFTDARRTYRVPPAPPLDPMWRAIEAAAFAPPTRRSAPGWRLFAAGIAAALLLGVAGGRLSVRSAPVATVGAHENARGGDPYLRTAEDVLGRTAVLLSAVRAEGSQDGVDARLTDQAGQLLSTTRLLIDSPAGTDARLRSLLQDLEQVLAQVARLEPARTRNELPIISAAVDQRDLVPRIRSAVVELSLADY